MNRILEIRDRYLRDGLAVRLGGLASNLRRIQSFATREANRKAIEGLIEESKLFIEWTALETGWEIAAELVGLQVQLARWQCSWTDLWSDPELRTRMAEDCRQWSDRVLRLSGLLPSSEAVP